MNFERFRVQQHLETSLGCNNLENWHSYRNALESFHLPHQGVDEINKYLLEDGEDLFYKGLLSLGEALVEITQGKHSWATVKLYYSVFYFLRASLATKGVAIIRNGSLYVLEVRAGKSPEKRGSKKYRNDHIGIINIYKDIIGENDILLTNTINNQSVYEWLMGNRHQVNYRQRGFLEPDFSGIYHQARDALCGNGFSRLLDQYLEDNIPIYCFDEEHACIAAPIKRAEFTKRDLVGAGIKELSSKKLNAAKLMLDKCLQPESKILELYNEANI
ncbi:MAG: hypothetical protein KZQ97_20330 [Candidatus Thiodiazotropha sp. (ex Dulcina madagascariensis)]|nr:hypothetical protein [Candidatus Thiodiazotropha sp. (ex Dulcina madagascariensis)]